MTTAFIHRDLDVVADWLQLFASGLRASTANRAGRQSVLTAVHQDPDLTVQQRAALEELYVAFCDVTRNRRIRN
jgi:ectoine hydroxylase-related dioxygenase (phytanoyl-CoA dioxygenase family)